MNSSPTTEATVADLESLKTWIGRCVEDEDCITPRLIARYRAVLAPHLASPTAPDQAPLAIHWCLAPAVLPMSDLRRDAQPGRGGLLPPVPLPRRMWGGGDIELLQELRVGDAVTRRSSIADVRLKQGRSGTLCIVTVEHLLSTHRGLALREQQDILYRDAVSNPASPPQTAQAGERKSDLSWTVDASPVLLFRYSAITFNSHRIHYDRPYATEIEGYPGLIVHGPLQASLLLNLAAALSARAPTRFSYRAVAPLLADQAFQVHARRESPETISCWTEGPERQVSMIATVTV